MKIYKDRVLHENEASKSECVSRIKLNWNLTIANGAHLIAASVTSSCSTRNASTGGVQADQNNTPHSTKRKMHPILHAVAKLFERLHVPESS